MTLEGYTYTVTSVAFHPTNPTLLATGSNDNTAKIWNIDTGECIKTLGGHTREPRRLKGTHITVAFHPTNPTLLATGSNDRTAQIWHVDTGECIKTLDGHTGAVTSVAFHLLIPTLLATWSGDTTAKIWDVDTGECIKTLQWHTHWVLSVDFHPTNPTLLATGSYDNTAKIWNVDSAQFKSLQRKFDSEFSAAHPIVVNTLAGDSYTLEDWGLCKDLKAAVCELAPEPLGQPDTFELLGNLGERTEEGGDEGGAAQIDGKHGSCDRHKMLAKGHGIDFEFTLVYSTAAAAAAEK